jgi:hypothetical protein
MQGIIIFLEQNSKKILNDKKNILICPLDWGLGHATRCVPVIREFIDSGANVLLAADNRPLAFLKKEFPSLPVIKFPGYQISYPEKGSMVLKMFFSFPRILAGIRKEHNLLQKIIEEHKIDVVVSDNRYGLWSKKARCVFITHQLKVKCPAWLKLFEYILFRMNKGFISRYDECWIPDSGDEFKLSGELSSPYKRFRNTYFVGVLSRFQNILIRPADPPKYDVLCILSGPEPQRTVLEKIILKQLKKYETLKALVVRGITERDGFTSTGNIQQTDHLESLPLAEAIAESGIVVCRPGYSSIMDIATIGKKAILIATPGQTEQEYLSRYYVKRKLFYSVSQKKFDLLESIERSRSYTGIKIKSDQQLLKGRIQQILK